MEIKTQTNVSIRVGSKTLVTINSEPFTRDFEAGTGHFKIMIEGKTINCYTEPGALDSLNSGKKVRIPKYSATNNKEK